jgi:Tol biopolymer transport system component
MSRDTTGKQITDFDFYGETDISDDGRYVVFSTAEQLVPEDVNGKPDVYRRDRATGTTVLVSVATSGVQGDSGSSLPSISGDGRVVAFNSDATNLLDGNNDGVTDTNEKRDIFVRYMETGVTSLVSRAGNDSGNYWSGGSYGVALSFDGRYVAFQSSATNLVPRDTNRLGDVFVHDRRTGKTSRVSVRSDGKQAGRDRTNTGSNAPAISADGRFVAFHSLDTNLVPGDTNRTADIFVRDLKLHRTARVSVGSGEQQANGESLGGLTISADGRFVAFTSLASNLVPRDLNDITDVFLRDRRTGTTTLVSRGIGGRQGDDASAVGGAGAGLVLSSGARFLAFSSWAANFVPRDTNDKPDAFVRKLRP